MKWMASFIYSARVRQAARSYLAPLVGPFDPSKGVILDLGEYTPDICYHSLFSLSDGVLLPL